MFSRASDVRVWKVPHSFMFAICCRMNGSLPAKGVVVVCEDENLASTMLVQQRRCSVMRGLDAGGAEEGSFVNGIIRLEHDSCESGVSIAASQFDLSLTTLTCCGLPPTTVYPSQWSGPILDLDSHGGVV